MNTEANESTDTPRYTASTDTQAFYASIRAKARVERTPEAFHPDGAHQFFYEFGGVECSACFIDAEGRLVMGVRIDADVPLPFLGKATVLKAAGMLLFNPQDTIYTAMQPELFTQTFKRALSDGTVITPCDQSPGEQGLSMMKTNAQLQVQLKEILTAPFRKTLRPGKMRASRDHLDVLINDLAAHMRDLKQISQQARSPL